MNLSIPILSISLFFLLFSFCHTQNDDFLYDTFPEGFLWGLSTSAYQIEGGAYTDGKGLTNWDYWSHNGSFEGDCNVLDCQNPDVSADSYHLYQHDSQALAEMGANIYRFSLSWARIVPTGRITDGVNQAGIDHYSRVIDSLLARNIQPFVTLYHWDLPLPLMWDGSWLNEQIIYHFMDYARIAFECFGDRVKFWMTFNEPYVFCLADWTYGYKNSFQDSPVKPYKCSHNVLKAHALAWRLYDQQFRPSQSGQVGLAFDCNWPLPLDPQNPDHVDASDRALHFYCGWYVNPLLRGEYPPIMRAIVDAQSKAEGRSESRLPKFDAGWTQMINGTLDFLALNHYTSFPVVPKNTDYTDSKFIHWDAEVSVAKRPTSWKLNALGWAITPFGIKNVINWIWKEYQFPIYITENGYLHWANDTVTDPIRVDFFRNYVNNVLKAVRLDGADVRGYAAWALLDNLEGTNGYSIRSGVHYIDFESQELRRQPKDSARFLAQVFANNGFPAPYEKQA